MLFKGDFTEKEKYIETGKARLVYSLFRLHQFAYFPLLVTSLFTLSWYSNTSHHPNSFKTAVVLSVFALVCL